MVPEVQLTQLTVELALQEALEVLPMALVLVNQEVLRVLPIVQLQQVGPKCFPQVVARQKVHLRPGGLQVVHPWVRQVDP